MAEKLRLGIAGLGTVGSALVAGIENSAKQIQRKTGCQIEIAGVCARQRDRQRDVAIDHLKWFDDPLALATSDEVDVFIELMGTIDDPALGAISAALECAKHVITANKAMLSRHGVRLAALAEEKGGLLQYEAAIAGGIPAVKIMRESLAGVAVSRVYGIMNGTCNFILTEMTEKNISFDEALAEATRLGYAEADPTFDVDGHDTAHKLSLLTSLAFGVEIDFDAIYMEGIRKISPIDIAAADELGYRIKLLGVANQTDAGIEQRVHPALVPRASIMARTDGVTNAVAVDASMVGTLVFAGPGAGGAATASAILADIADIAAGRRAPALGWPQQSLNINKKARMRAHEGGYFIRLSVKDQPGTLAAVTAAMSAHGISLESILQRSRAVKSSAPATPHPAAAQPVIMITYETTEETVNRAFDDIVKAGVLTDEPRMIRIETFG